MACRTPVSGIKPIPKEQHYITRGLLFNLDVAVFIQKYDPRLAHWFVEDTLTRVRCFCLQFFSCLL